MNCSRTTGWEQINLGVNERFFGEKQRPASGSNHRSPGYQQPSLQNDITQNEVELEQVT